MIPILFKPNETNFNTNGVGHLKETIDYEVREVRNGEFELTLTYPATGRFFKEIKDFSYILAKPNDVDDDHIFRIYETIKDATTQTITVYGSTKTNDLGGNLVRHVSVVNETPQQAMIKMKSNLVDPTDYNFVSDINTTSSTEWIRRNPLNCIAGEEGSLVSYWGGEIKRTNDTIFLYSRRGKDRVTTIRPGKNLDGFTVTNSTKGLITRVLPFFTYIPEGKEEPVTITGTIVNSPLMNNYPVRYITPVDYSGDESVNTLAKLNQAASRYFIDRNPDSDKPKVNLDVDLLQLSDSSEYSKFKDLEHISLTDTVMVWIEKFDVDVEVKVTELVYNGMKEQVTSLVAGSTSTGLYDAIQGDYQYDITELQKYVSNMENGVLNVIQLTADSKNRIFRGYTQPDVSISKEGDLWYKELGSGEVEVQQFDGAYWQPLITAGLNAAVIAEINAILLKMETDKAQTEADIAQAVIDANEYTNLKAVEFDDKFLEVNNGVVSATELANTAVSKAATAISEAGFAKSDASSALTKVNDAEIQISTIQGYYDDLTGRVSSIEVSIDGIRTSVSNKAEQSEVTQLAGVVATKVASETYNTKMTQLDNSINLRLTQTQVDTSILQDKMIKDTRSDNQPPSWYYTNYPKQTAYEFKTRTVIGVPGSSTYVSLTTKVPWSDSSGGYVHQVASSSDGTYERYGSTTWTTWQKLAETGELISQINLSTEGILLQGKRIQLDGDVYMTTAYVDTIQSRSLDAVYANVATLRTKMLTTDVIYSGMIKSDESLVGKIFATTANIDVLTAKTAFINSIKAIDISATNITGGTFNGDNMNIININVSSLVGNTTNFVTSSWNQNGSDVRISSGGIITTSVDGSQTYIQNGVVGTRNPSGATIGQLGYVDDIGKPTYVLRTSWGSHFKIRNTTDENGGFVDSFKILSGGSEMYLDSSTIYANGRLDPYGGINMNSNIQMNNRDIINTGYLRFNTGGFLYSHATNSTLYIAANTDLSLYSRGTRGALMSSSHWLMFRTLSMEGYSITNQSDRRLKTDIKASSIDALSAILKWSFVNYRWRDKDRPSGTHLGLIAQDSPEIQVYDSKRDIYSIDNGKQTMIQGIAIQQLYRLVKQSDGKVDMALSIGHKNMGEQEKLKIQIKDLQNRLDELESVS